MSKAKERMRAFEKRDEDKMKTDKAKNDFESVIYAMRDWLSEDNNLPFVAPGESDSLMTQLYKEEEWLLDGEGEHASYSEYNKRFQDLNNKFQSFKNIKNEYISRES